MESGRRSTKMDNFKNLTIYQYGKKHGMEIWYHQNGKKQSEVLYENDKIQSRLLRWDEKGDQIIN